MSSTGTIAIQEAFQRFYRVQDRYACYGAYDSEPCYVMRSYLRKSLRFDEGPARLPTTAEDWQLYTCSMKCGNAARSLTSALKKLEKKLQKAPMMLRDEIYRHLC